MIRIANAGGSPLILIDQIIVILFSIFLSPAVYALFRAGRASRLVSLVAGGYLVTLAVYLGLMSMLFAILMALEYWRGQI